MDIQGVIKTTLKPQPLLVGLGMASSIYLVIFLFVGLGAGKTLHKMEEKLASDSVAIERPIQAIFAHPGATDDANSAPHGQGRPITPPITKGPSLTPAPLAGLYLQEPEGLLPKISPSGMTPFDGYKKPGPQTQKPLVAIIITDFGLSQTASNQILRNLPSEVSLILSPYADHLDDLQKTARAAGHELWLGLPLVDEENANHDFGPQALSQGAGLKQNQDRYLWALSRTTGYVGVASMIGNDFNNANTAIKNIFTDIFDRGLGYLEINPSAGKAIENIAKSKRAPYAKNIQFLENTSLKALETIAEGRGYVIGVVHPNPNTIKSLKSWLDTLEAKGFALAPVSAIAAQNRH